MGRYVYRILFLIFGVAFLVYLALPAPTFPDTLWDFKQSTEPADQETPLRRGYFTNVTREQLMSHYAKEFGWGLRLNYPPEHARVLIRDQTKTSFLEEIVHPMRESLYVNGYNPRSDQEILMKDDVRYDGKVIIKFVPSNVFLRLFIGLCSLGLAWLLINEWSKSLKSLKWISR
jgi:hypothetical protein